MCALRQSVHVLAAGHAAPPLPQLLEGFLRRLFKQKGHCASRASTCVCVFCDNVCSPRFLMSILEQQCACVTLASKNLAMKRSHRQRKPLELPAIHYLLEVTQKRAAVKFL